MRHGNYWTVEFTTGGQGNCYATRKAAAEYAAAANGYSERHSGERAVRSLVQYSRWERVAVVAA